MFGKKRTSSQKNAKFRLIMLISIKNNLAFLAMTKTGSTAVEQSLVPFCDIIFTHDPRLKHMQLKKFERFLRPYLHSLNIDQVQTTCLFRDPIDWLGSWYRYRSRSSLDGKPNSTAKVSFNQFIENYLSETPEPFAKIGRQSKFVMNRNGDVGIDHLFRYEDFAQFERFISDRFSQTFEFDRRNVSPKIDIQLSSALRKALYENLALDFEIHEKLAKI